jgi:hypothetical protein
MNNLCNSASYKIHIINRPIIDESIKPTIQQELLSQWSIYLIVFPMIGQSKMNDTLPYTTPAGIVAILFILKVYNAHLILIRMSQERICGVELPLVCINAALILEFVVISFGLHVGIITMTRCELTLSFYPKSCLDFKNLSIYIS